MKRPADSPTRTDIPAAIPTGGAWETWSGRGVVVRAPRGSHASVRGSAASELRDAERLLDALARLLAPPSDRRGGPVEILLVDAVSALAEARDGEGDGRGPTVSPAASADAFTAAIVRAVGPDSPGEPLALALTRGVVRRWFGADAARAKVIIEGIAGLAAGRARSGESVAACDRWVRAELEAGRAVAVTGRKRKRARDARRDGSDRTEGGETPGPGDGLPPVGAPRSAVDNARAATSFVAFLLAYAGPSALRQYLAAYDPERHDAAALRAYQQPLGVLEEAWLASLRRRVGATNAMRSLLRRVWPLLRPHRWKQTEIAAYTALAACGNFVVPFATRWFVDRVKGLKDLKGAAGQMGADWFIRHDLPIFVVVLLCLYALNSLVSLRRAYTVTWLNQRILNQLQVRLFAHLQRLPHSFYDRAKIGDVMARLTTDLESVQQALGQVTNKGVYQLFTLAGGIVAFVIVAAGALPLLLAVLPLAPLFAAAFAGLRGRNKAASRELRRRAGETAARTQEGLSAYAVVKAFGMQERVVAEYEARVEAQQKSKLRLAVLGAVADLSEDVITGIAQVAILGVGGYYVAQGRLALGDLLAALMVMKYVFGPIASLAGIGQTLQQAVGSLERIEELEQEPVTIADAEGATALPPLARDIRLERVTFGYPGRGAVLRDLDLTIRAGENVAIVGPTGSGKSTTISLLMRFADPDAGRILLDGHDLRDVTLASLRGQISVVFQDTFLFDLTIRENIRIGRPSATDDEVKEAAKKAQLHQTIKALPDGYNTLVGERGVRLSGGQRQRLAIARAILRDSPILLLDEATSALDATTEAGLLDTLRQIARGRTTVSVTHRLSWAQRADRIFVLDRGELVEEGTHAELLARGGLYRRLYDEQTGSEVAAQGAGAETLRATPLFSELDAPALRAIAQRLTPMRVPAGAEVVAQGEPGDRLYVIMRGSAEVVLARDGGERRLAALSDGDYFGEMALVSDAPRTATVRATTALELLALSREAFLSLLDSEPRIRQAVAATIADRRAALAAMSAPGGMLATPVPDRNEAPAARSTTHESIA